MANQTLPAPNSPVSLEKKSLGAKVKSGAVAALMGIAYLVYMLLTGGGFGSTDFTGQDLRGEGDRFRRGDLVGAIFNEANISALEMVGANLHETEMIEVIAEETDLYQAIFVRADLRNANFRGARLQEADFSNSDLTGADLRGADIRGVDFSSTILDGADLRDTRVGDSCDYRSSIPAACRTPEDGCCEMVWEASHINGLMVCRNPFSRVLTDAGNVGGMGVMGEAIFSEPNTVVDGETLCPAVFND